MKTILTMICAGVLLIASSCEKNSQKDMQPANDNSVNTQERSAVQPLQYSSVYYNGGLFNVKMMRSAVSNSATVNLLYVFKTPAGSTAVFRPVINKLPTGNFDANVVWQRIEVSFTADARPTQPTSEADIWKMITAGLATAEKTEAYFQMAITYALDPNTK